MRYPRNIYRLNVNYRQIIIHLFPILSFNFKKLFQLDLIVLAMNIISGMNFVSVFGSMIKLIRGLNIQGDNHAYSSLLENCKFQVTNFG